MTLAELWGECKTALTAVDKVSFVDTIEKVDQLLSTNDFRGAVEGFDSIVAQLAVVDSDSCPRDLFLHAKLTVSEAQSAAKDAAHAAENAAHAAETAAKDAVVKCKEILNEISEKELRFVGVASPTKHTLGLDSFSHSTSKASGGATKRKRVDDGEKVAMNDQLEGLGKEARGTTVEHEIAHAMSEEEKQELASFANVLQPCMAELREKKKEIKEEADVHQVANAVCLFALRNTTSAEKDIRGYRSQSTDVWFMLEPLSESCLKSATELRKYVSENVIKKGKLTVVGKREGHMSREADMLVVRHELPPGANEEEKRWITHSGKITGCHAASAVLAMEWKKVWGKAVEGADVDHYVAVGELIRDFGYTLAPHWQSEMRYGFGIASDGVEWSFYKCWVDEKKICFHTDTVSLTDDLGMVLKEDAFRAQLAKLVNRIRSAVVQSTSPVTGWRGEKVGECVEVLAQHSATVCKMKRTGGEKEAEAEAENEKQKEDDDDAIVSHVVIKFALGSGVTESSKKRREKLHREVTQLDKLRRKAKNANGLATLKEVLPLAKEDEGAWRGLPEGLRLGANKDWLVFRDNGMRLDQWCLCNGDRADRLLKCVARSSEKASSSNEEAPRYGTSRVWRQLEAIHKAGFVLLDICFTNMVWNGQRDAVSLVDFETLTPIGVAVEKPWEVRGFDVFGSKKQEFEEYYKTHNDEEWDGKTASVWIDLYKMTLVETWLKARVKRHVGKGGESTKDKCMRKHALEQPHTSLDRRTALVNGAVEATKRTKSMEAGDN